MASSVEFVEYVCGQAEGAGDVSYRKMFGEYGIYLDGKFIGVICDNQFFVKITKAGEEAVLERERTNSSRMIEKIVRSFRKDQ